MAGDLERFLQEAAERLAQRTQQGNQPPRRQQNQRGNVRQAERRRPDPEIVDAEIVDAELVSPQTMDRRRGPDPLSNIDTRPPLAQEIGQADERMQGHIDEVMDHDIMELTDASKALASDGEASDGQVQRRRKSTSPLIQMLRNANTLRSAFIASEIFRRKF